MGGWWANPLQTLTQGLALTFDVDVDPDPELDKNVQKTAWQKKDSFELKNNHP